MKTLIVLALLAVGISAQPTRQEEQINGVNGWYVPQIDGSFLWMDMDEVNDRLAQEAIKPFDILPDPVTYYLYTRSNPSKGQKISQSTSSIAASYFNPANPTKFVIHGWTQSYTSPMNKWIRDAWLSRGDFNVIIVDWARARSLEYISSVSSVEDTGKKVAAMIDYLSVYGGMKFGSVTVIGHSLGAHVAGYAGKNVKRGQIYAIVGLDAALPLFFYSKPTNRLSETDAFYVESIHTDGDNLGFLKPIGKAAFYPNGGKNQPGCTFDLTGACSHGRSNEFYAEAVRSNSFPSMKCSSYEAAVKNNCGTTYSSTRMGNELTSAVTASGSFYVPVKSKSPFGMAA